MNIQDKRDWIRLVQDAVYWRAVSVNVMNLRGSQNAENILPI
jgi:hypothetical protein